MGFWMRERERERERDLIVGWHKKKLLNIISLCYST